MKRGGSNFLKGYTMVELLLVIAVISILSVVAMASSFRYNQLLSNLLNDVNSVTMLMREMQNKTTSFIASNSGVNEGYGVFLDLNNKNKIEPFYKTNRNPFSPTEATSPKPDQNLLLGSSNYFSRICLNGCSTYSSATKVAIYFLKPKPYIIFSIPYPNTSTTYINTIPGQPNTKINRACIELASYSGNYKKRIDIHYVGQISFASGPCQ